MGRRPFERSFYADKSRLLEGAKAFEKNRYRPMYAGANMGHPSIVVRERNLLAPVNGG